MPTMPAIPRARLGSTTGALPGIPSRPGSREGLRSTSRPGSRESLRGASKSRSPEPRGSRSPEPRGSRSPEPRPASRSPEPRLRRPGASDIQKGDFMQHVCSGDAGALELLLRRTPMLCEDDRGVLGTAVLYAASNLDLATFKVLNRYGADMNIHDALGMSWEDKARRSAAGPEAFDEFYAAALLLAGPARKDKFCLVPFRRSRQR